MLPLKGTILLGRGGWHMKKPGNKKLLKSNRISGFQKADHQKLPIDKTRRIISQKFHFFKIFKVGLIGALIFGILFELALEHVPGAFIMVYLRYYCYSYPEGNMGYRQRTI